MMNWMEKGKEISNYCRELKNSHLVLPPPPLASRAKRDVTITITVLRLLLKYKADDNM